MLSKYFFNRPIWHHPEGLASRSTAIDQRYSDRLDVVVVVTSHSVRIVTTFRLTSTATAAAHPGRRQDTVRPEGYPLRGLHPSRSTRLSQQADVVAVALSSLETPKTASASFTSVKSSLMAESAPRSR